VNQLNKSVSVQSVLYGNPEKEIVTAARAVSNSAKLAQADGYLSSWKYCVGDCSPVEALSKSGIKTISEIVTSNGGEFVYEFFAANLGSAAGHNSLAALSKSDFIVVLNPDAQVAPDSVGLMLQAMREGAGSVEARQVPLEHPKDYIPGTGVTGWSSTAYLMTSREAFEKVGGFDSETFFLYCDDVDYSWRIRLAGYQVLYDPAVTVFHDKRLSIKAEWLSSDAEVFYSAQAALLLAYKYSRDDVLHDIREDFVKSTNPEIARALSSFEELEEDGNLPSRIDHQHKVAEFTNGAYTRHRF
jgi:hypothetical protein